MRDWISQPVSYFHGKALPEQATPAGYAALVERFELAVPLPPRLTAIAERHHPAPMSLEPVDTTPPPTLSKANRFALKWGG
jgi:hypothetical protein